MNGWRVALGFIGIGWFIAISIIGGIALGLWLDGLADSRPLFTLVGALLGVAIAFYGMFRLLAPLLGQHDGPDQHTKKRE